MKAFTGIKSIIFAGTALMVSGCGTTVVDLDNPEEKAAMSNVMALEYRDFEKAANKAVQEMISSGAVTNRSGGRYVLVISRITNDTMQKIDTDQLIKKIRTQLLQSGKVVVTSAVGLDGAEDPMVMKARQLRKSKEVNQANVAKKGTIVAPDLSLSGKIIQRNLDLDFGGERVEYYFQLTLTDLTTGLAIWEGETPIIKEGRKAPIW
ncbi:MAG: penicillin-binding protein activator LpoB [Alphaproteobacteria bacterium]|nr:penicillin-binding protein activator LpoB [Alphaproteobacteria bacterium]